MPVSLGGSAVIVRFSKAEGKREALDLPDFRPLDVRSTERRSTESI